MSRNDILRKHKIIPEKPPSPTPIIQEAIENARALAHENRLEDKNLEELNALEDEEEDEFLQKYRWVQMDKLSSGLSNFRNSNQRLAELSKITKTSVFNQVYHLQKPDYSKDVTEASQNALVLVHLTSSLGTNVESRLLTELWRELATKYGDIKFCEIQANMCIEGYPEKNTPTILIYSKGNINRQLITLRELKGISTRLQGWQ